MSKGGQLETDADFEQSMAALVVHGKQYHGAFLYKYNTHSRESIYYFLTPSRHLAHNIIIPA